MCSVNTGRSNTGPRHTDPSPTALKAAVWPSSLNTAITSWNCGTPELRFREVGAQVSIIGPSRSQTYRSVLGYPVIPDDDVNAAAANYDLLVVPGGSAARHLAEADAARQPVESHLTKGRDHSTAGSADGRRAVSGALYASKIAYSAVSRAKIGLVDEVVRGFLADNPRRLLKLTPA